MRFLLAAALAAVALVAAALTARGTAPAPGAEAPKRTEAPRDRIVLQPAALAQATAAGLVPTGTRSLLRIDGPLRYGQFVWRDRGVPEGPVEIVVDLRTQVLSVFRSGHEIASTVVLYGADAYETPLGEHPIRAKARHHHSQAYDAPMPYTLWLTGDGVAIHASDVRRGRATHGCIGVPEAFAERLFTAAQVGDTVRIVRSTERQARAAS